MIVIVLEKTFSKAASLRIYMLYARVCVCVCVCVRSREILAGSTTVIQTLPHTWITMSCDPRLSRRDRWRKIERFVVVRRDSVLGDLEKLCSRNPRERRLGIGIKTAGERRSDEPYDPIGGARRKGRLYRRENKARRITWSRLTSGITLREVRTGHLRHGRVFRGVEKVNERLSFDEDEAPCLFQLCVCVCVAVCLFLFCPYFLLSYS